MKIQLAIRLVFLLFLSMFFFCHTLQASESANDLRTKVAALKLGINDYAIGTALSAEKKEYATSHLLDGAYEGTYKFNDGDTHVVVAETDDTVLALYQRQEEADFKQAQKMISGLMGLFGNPTTMAHDKLIYWAYNDVGKIPEEEYAKIREEAKKLNILATVKFSSTFEMTEENRDKQLQGPIYFIISSDQLTAAFMKK